MKYRVNSIQTKYKGQSLKVVKSEVVFGDERPREFEYLERPEIALIIPIMNISEAIVISQYRAATNQFIWEFPAGKRIAEEAIYDTASRELGEETGYTSENLKFLGEFYTAPHFTNEKVYVFLAFDLVPCCPQFQENEVIDIHIKQIESLESLFIKAEISDAKSLVALHLMNNYLKQ